MPPKYYVKFIDRDKSHYIQIFNEGRSDLIFEIEVNWGWDMNIEKKMEYLKSIFLSILKDIFDIKAEKDII